MKPEFLSLLAVDGKLINDYDALSAGVCRYVGRKWDSETRSFPTTEPSKVKPLPEYVKAVQCGDLMSANEETAAYCGVVFHEQKK